MIIYTETEKKEIERYYNRGIEEDVQYCRFDDIPNSLKVEIKKILGL
jgi:hypothetical protein